VTDGSVSFYDLPAVDSLSRDLKIDPQAIRRARVAFFKKSLGQGEALAQIPEAKRRLFGSRVRFRFLTGVRRFESQIDRATKLVSTTERGYSIESVLLQPATGRVALCVSSQVGCAAACEFCATGQMGVAQSLSADEILAQVSIANESLASRGQRVRNLVFMGMGEPLHNEAALHAVLRVLHSSAAFDHPPSRTLVSTVGVPDALVRTAEAFPTTGFALSLHAARQGVRERIVPLARRHDVQSLREAVAVLNAIQPAKTGVMIEYVMLRGVNDSEVDAAALLEWVDGLRVHVNLIPFNPIEGKTELGASPKSTIERFGARVRSAGVPTTIRYSLGADIEAACGQLVRQENRDVVRRLASTRVAERPSSGARRPERD